MSAFGSGAFTGEAEARPSGHFPAPFTLRLTVEDAGGPSNPAATKPTGPTPVWRAIENGVLAATVTAQAPAARVFPGGGGNYWELTLPGDDPAAVSALECFVDRITAVTGSSPALLGLTTAENMFRNCTALASVPTFDFSAVTTMRYAFSGTAIAGVSARDTGRAASFYSCFFNCPNLAAVPAFDYGSATDCESLFQTCPALATCPAGLFDTAPCTNWLNAFVGCALDQASVDNILVSIERAGTSNGTLTITGGTSAAPSATGTAAKTALQARGWTVNTK